MNTVRLTTALAVSFGLALSAAAAGALDSSLRQDRPTQRSGQHQSDPPSSVGNVTGKTNGSGTIKEITADQFDEIDVNDDLRISLSEFTSSSLLSEENAAVTGQLPTVAAPRTDGTVVIKPSSGRNTAELFRRLDRNQDQYLDSVEIAAFYLDELED